MLRNKLQVVLHWLGFSLVSWGDAAKMEREDITVCNDPRSLFQFVGEDVVEM